jgi:hypothetical protein
MPLAQGEYTARNNSAARGGRIHSDDEFARKYGFTGGLVPGITVYAYVTDLLEEVLGRSWREKGTISLRYRSGTYEGERIRVVAEESAKQGEVDLKVFGQDGSTRAVGVAGTDISEPSGDCRVLPVVEAPSAPLSMTSEALLDHPMLGTTEVSPTAAGSREYLGSIGLSTNETLGDVFVNSAYLVRTYRECQARTFTRVFPSVLASSEVRHYRGVRYDEMLSVRGCVDRLFGRNGNWFAVLEFVWYDSTDTRVLDSRQCSVFKLRPKAP